MPKERIVLGRKGGSSMVAIRWTSDCPDELDDIETAEYVGAVWEGDELVTYDMEGLKELLAYQSQSGEYTIDND